MIGEECVKGSENLKGLQLRCNMLTNQINLVEKRTETNRMHVSEALIAVDEKLQKLKASLFFDGVSECV